MNQGLVRSNFTTPENNARSVTPETDPELLVNSIDARQRLILKGSIGGKACKILIDSGANNNYVSDAFVEQHNLPTFAFQGRSIVSADGRIQHTFDLLKNTTVRIGSNREKRTFQVMPLSI